MHVQGGFLGATGERAAEGRERVPGRLDPLERTKFTCEIHIHVRKCTFTGAKMRRHRAKGENARSRVKNARSRAKMHVQGGLLGEAESRVRRGGIGWSAVWTPLKGQNSHAKYTFT